MIVPYVFSNEYFTKVLIMTDIYIFSNTVLLFQYWNPYINIDFFDDTRIKRIKGADRKMLLEKFYSEILENI